MLEVQTEIQSRGQKALWVLLGLAVPVLMYLVTRSRKAEEPTPRAAEPTPALELPVQEPPPLPVDPEVVEPVAVVIAQAQTAGGIEVQVEDSQDGKHSVKLVGLDEKKAVVQTDHAFQAKEKVKILIPTDGGSSALSLAAVLAESQENRHEFRFMGLRAGTRERLLRYLDEQTFE